MGLQIGWFRPEHTKDEKKKNDFESTIRNSTVVLDRLLEILTAQEESLNSFESNLENYDDGWLAKQAYVNGRKSHICDLRKLLTIHN
jgi:predicted metal-dependent HD superfamily phosphohydrolase